MIANLFSQKQSQSVQENSIIAKETIPLRSALENERPNEQVVYSCVPPQRISKADLPPSAYPRDEPMHSDMADYGQAIVPELSFEDRAALNTARDSWMGNDEAANWASVTSKGRQFWVACKDYFLEACEESQKASEQQRMAPVQNFGLGLWSLVTAVLQIGMGWDIPMKQFIDENAAILNVAIWIFLLEVLHRTAGCFVLVGWAAATVFIQGLTSPFLLRCYYALLARTSPSWFPALHVVRILTISAVKGLWNPATKRPPVLHLILVVRLLFLLQTICSCWLEAYNAALYRFLNSLHVLALQDAVVDNVNMVFDGLVTWFFNTRR